MVVMSLMLATVESIEKAWRPLKPTETDRAEYWIGVASRKVARRWPDVSRRIKDPADPLTAEDVSDVIVALVLSVIPRPVAGARTWQESAGSFSHSVTLPAGDASRQTMEFEDWMIEVFALARAGGVVPTGGFPEPQPFDPLFLWGERP